MHETRFWMIRHALVEENVRARLYGIMDVEVCPHTMVAQEAMYRALAARLPRPAQWVVTTLSRTRRTAEAIWRAGYPTQVPLIEPGLIEQDMGDWHNLPHAEVVGLLTIPSHAFWPMGGQERPPNGESVAEMIERVAATMERLGDAHAGEDVVIVSHGGAIRSAVAHALRIGPDNALHLSVDNLSLTRLERLPAGWRVTCVNELTLTG